LLSGWLARARAGEIKGFTGVDAPDEPPERPEIHVDTSELDVVGAFDRIIQALELAGEPAAVRP
jgi:adenylylsulfate kinase-like enzyme